jgi:hypothetical protein
MWKCECGANNEEEALTCINCGQERGQREFGLGEFIEPPPTPSRERGFEGPTMRGRGFEEPAREKTLEEVYPPPEEEFFVEEERAGPSIKKVFRIVVASLMSILILIISFYAFIKIGGIRETAFLEYVRQCIGIWIRCIILTQAVVIIGLILVFLLRESKSPKAL